jgi:hypothetical protein
MSTGLILEAGSIIPWIYKTPGGVLDYPFNWEKWLGTDTIATAVWTVPTGLTKTAQSETETVANAWISGGVIGTSYKVSCKITTVGGRTEERTIEIRVVVR